MLGHRRAGAGKAQGNTCGYPAVDDVRPDSNSHHEREQKKSYQLTTQATKPVAVKIPTESVNTGVVLVTAHTKINNLRVNGTGVFSQPRGHCGTSNNISNRSTYFRSTRSRSSITLLSEDLLVALGGDIDGSNTLEELVSAQVFRQVSEEVCKITKFHGQHSGLVQVQDT